MIPGGGEIGEWVGDEGQTYILAVLIVAFVIASSIFWERHQEMMNACKGLGHAHDYCWNVLR